MTPSARLSAAIALLDEILDRKRPLGPALADWGKANRYAGSGDRNAIGNLVHDTLRVKASAQWIMGLKGDAENGRAALLGMLRLLRGMEGGDLGALHGDRFAPAPLTEAERASLQAADLSDAPALFAAITRNGSMPSLRKASVKRVRQRLLPSPPAPRSMRA